MRSPLKIHIFYTIIVMFLFSLSAPIAFGADSVLINEIAWTGTSANSADEWIELYNSSSGIVDLTGWGLYEAGGSTLILNLSGTIAVGGYYLIERTDDNSISDILADVFGSFVGSGLNNSGENLVLKDSGGLVVDYIDASSGWPAGDSASKASMERKADGTWQTNNGVTINGKDAQGGNIVGTPKAQNSSVASGTASSSVIENQTVGSGESGSGVSMGTSTPIILLKADAGQDVVAEVNQKIKFDASKSEGANSYKWYLGDGAVKEGINIEYGYQFSGTYLVTLEVSNGSEVSLDQIRVSIFGGKVLINEIFVGQSSSTSSWIEIFNPNKSTIDIGGWILESGKKNFILPPFSIVATGGYFVVSQAVSGLDVSAGSIKIKYPNGLTMDEVVFDKVQSGFSASRTSSGFFWTKEVTPGGINIVTSSGAALLENMKVVPNLVKQKPESLPAKNYLASFYNQVEASSLDYAELGNKQEEENSFWSKLPSGLLFWVVSVMVLGFGFGLLYIRLINKKQ